MRRLEISHAGEDLVLFAEKALFWKRRQTLVIADPHFGKSAAFRQAGIPVPEGGTATDLARLNSLIAETCSRRLLVLGDFFHAKSGRTDATMQLLAEWCGRRRGLEIVLTPGNHDRGAGAPPECWSIHSALELHDPPFTFRHESARHHQTCTVAGHLHPCFTMAGGFGKGLRAPCFWLTPHSIVLPAFGEFTGTHPIAPERTDRVFGIDRGDIFEVPQSLLR